MAISKWQLAKPTAKASTTEDAEGHRGKPKIEQIATETSKLTSIYLQAEKSEGSKWDGS
jgi:hypothetical protein